MIAKDLAEMMINGDLDYTPENDAYHIALKYIELADEVERSLLSIPSLESRIKLRLILSEDPAKVQ